MRWTGTAGLTVLTAVGLSVGGCAVPRSSGPDDVTVRPSTVSSSSAAVAGSTSGALDSLPVKGRAPMTGYTRAEFGTAWTDTSDAPWSADGLSTREDVLSRDLTEIVCKHPPPRSAAGRCVVRGGVLRDPYSGQTVVFVRGVRTSQAVQIDHVVALGDAWQTGAQHLRHDERVDLANDPLELVAVDGPTNEAKGDGDAATWLPPNKRFRCAYVARQVAVKVKYHLWVTSAEKAAIGRVLSGCPGQVLPTDATAEQPTA